MKGFVKVLVGVAAVVVAAAVGMLMSKGASPSSPPSAEQAAVTEKQVNAWMAKHPNWAWQNGPPPQGYPTPIQPDRASDEEIGALAELPPIGALSLRGGISAAGVKRALALQPGLRTLMLEPDIVVDDALIAEILKLKNLEALFVQGDAAFTAEGFAALAGRESLNTLSFRNGTFPIDDEMLRTLKNRKTLAYLSISGKLRATGEIQDELREAFPEARIYIDPE